MSRVVLLAVLLTPLWAQAEEGTSHKNQTVMQQTDGLLGGKQKGCPAATVLLPALKAYQDATEKKPRKTDAASVVKK
jgi:hypothetical protein